MTTHEIVRNPYILPNQNKYPLLSLTGNQRFPALIPMIKTSSLCLRFNSKEQVRV